MLVVSSMSFQTIESVQSADVVGSNRIELILYKPIANQTKLIPTKISFGTCVSHSKFPKMVSNLKMLVKGVKMAELVVEMEKMFRFFPDMYIIKAFIATCDPGFVAIAMALAFLFASRAAEFWGVTELGVALLRSPANKLP